MKLFTSLRFAVVSLLLGLVPTITNGAQGLANWAKWVQNPPTIPVSVCITDVYAESGTPFYVSLADGVSVGYGHPGGCSQATNAPTLFANVNVRREYLLTVVATNLQQMKLDLAVRPPAQLLSKSGSDAVAKFYTILLDRQVARSITASTNSCTYYSNSWVVEIRDQQGAHWIVDDQSNDPGPAPGDANPLQIGPAKSLLTNHITIDWSVSLGRLYDGLAAGRLRLSESSLSREAYTPKAIFYAAASTNVRSQVELVCAQADGALRQAKAFQCFVDVIDPWTFSASDLTDLHSLAGRLTTETNGVSLYVFRHLPAATQQAVTNYYYGTNSTTDPLPLLVHDFNALIAGPSMYDASVWTNVTFSAETLFLLAQSPQGPDLLRLNRLLLQDAYTTQIAQRPYQTALNFYFPAQVGASTNQDGVYTNITGSPFVSYYVRNPQPTATTNLALVEARNGTSYTNSLVFTPQAGSETWVLTSGSGNEQKREVRGIGFSSGATTHRFETNTVRYASSPTDAYKCVEDYQLLGWGWELVQTRVDPEGANLVTSFDFYPDQNDPLAYGKPWIVRYPDGDWEVRWYDHGYFLGALQYLLRPFNGLPNDPEDANLGNCEVASYEPWEDLVGGINTEIVHYFQDDWEGMFYTDYIGNGFDGDLLCEADERVHYDYPWDHPMGTVRDRLPDSAGKGLTGHEAYSKDFQGANRAMYYQGGTFNEVSGTFAPGSGDIADGPDWRQSVVLWGLEYFYCPPYPDEYYPVSAIDGQPLYTGVYLYPGRTTREATVFHGGSQVRLDRAVFTGLAGEDPVFETFQSYVYKNDGLGHATNIALIDASNTNLVRTIHEASYQDANGKDGELLRWESDETGARTEYAYDSLKRVTQVRKVGITNALVAVPSLTTNLIYDAYGRLTQRTVSAGTLTQTYARSYDVAGRVLQENPETGLATNYVYSLSADGGQVVSIALPSGATVVREQYRDRRLKSQTGTGVVAEFHTYSARGPLLSGQDIGEVDNIHWVAADSPRWTLTAKDRLGLPSLTRSPDFQDQHYVDVLKHYGQWLTLPISITASGKGETWYEMDFDGQISSTAQNAVGYSSGRVAANRRQYAKLSGQWFYTQTNLAYLADSSEEPTVTGVSLERLSGFTSQSVLSEVTTIDADSNATVVTTFLDPVAKQLTQITTLPQSTLTPTNITVNGLLISESTATVATPSVHHYDALSRETSVTSPLGFTACRAYNDLGQVSSETDITGLQTTYEYYSNGVTGAGQLKSQTRNGKKTYYAFTARGELWHTWGDVPYPEERVYSQYGELKELHTFRGGSGWNQPSWPASPGAADVTTWTYQDTSGLLVAKTDHLGRSVSYTYENGMVKTRAWARSGENGSITSTYNYNEYGDLTGQSYNDNITPAVQLNDFNRAGLPRQIIDGCGISTLRYDYASRLVATEYTQGQSLLGGTTVTNHFDSLGRRDSLSLVSIGNLPLAIGYSYDSYGRMGTVSSGPYSAEYGYKPDSDLLQTTTCKNNGATVLTTTRAWDYGMRLHSIASVANATTVSSHTYTYDLLNRRAWATIEDGSAWNYIYNDRDELIGAHRYWPDSSYVAGQQYAYDYDSIGNRKTASWGGDASGGGLHTEQYTANGLSQYDCRNLPNPAWVQTIGAASASANVALSMANGICAPASRKGEYFRAEAEVASTLNQYGPVWLSLTNLAALPGGGSADMLASTSGHVMVPQTQQPFTYDFDGNLTSDGIWIYEWDGENRLVTMTMTNVANITTPERLQLKFAYDFQGRRVQKRVFHGGPGDWVLDSDARFVYDGWNLLAILNSSFNLQTSFIWGQDLSGTMDKAGGIGGLMLLTTHGSPSTNCFVGYDGNGNVTALLDAAAGATLARYEYSAYGETLRATGPMADANPIRYSSKYSDSETGLVNYGLRYYSPSLGRWISRDRTSDQLLELYCFTHNAPTLAIDPDGRWWFLVTMAAGGVVGYMTHPNDPWRGFLQGAAAGALGFGAGALLSGALGGGALAATVGVSGASVVSQYATFALDNYSANKSSWYVPSGGQALVMSAVGAGTFLAGGFAGALMAKAGGDVDETVLDVMLTLSSTIGAGAAEVWGGSAEAAYDAMSRALSAP